MRLIEVLDVKVKNVAILLEMKEFDVNLSTIISTNLLIIAVILEYEYFAIGSRSYIRN